MQDTSRRIPDVVKGALGVMSCVVVDVDATTASVLCRDTIIVDWLWMVSSCAARAVVMAPVVPLATANRRCRAINADTMSTGPLYKSYR